MEQPEERVLDLTSVFGVRAKITRSAESTGGELVEMECILDSGGGPTPHTHPHQEETFEVLHGVLEVLRGGEWRTATAGETVVVPAGEVHAFRNGSGAPVTFRNVHRPALLFQQHLETVDRLVRAGKVRSMKDPRSLMHLCMSAVKHRPDVQVSPPPWVIRTMAFIGRRLGYTLEG